MRLGPFFETYVQAAGQTLVPPVFHRWAAISLVAAALGNRVWVDKLNRPLYPNLYVMLVGPSGCGKGVAIDFAMDRWQDVEGLKDSGRLYRGAITKQRVLDLLGGRQTNTVGGKAQVGSAPPVPQPWLIAPELYNALGQSGRGAEAFIANLTDLYTGSPVPVMEGTRTWGDVSIVGHCINWLAGTTSQWLRKSLSPDAILSGFFGRVITVEGAYSATHQEAQFPANYGSLIIQLTEQLERISISSGVCCLDEDASNVRNQWLATRQPPDDEMMRPAYQRDDDLLLKLATILCMADQAVLESDGYTINKEHVIKARLLVNEARTAQASLVTLAHANPEMDSYQLVRDALKHAKRITHTMLLRRVTNRGVNAEKLRIALRTLTEEGRARQDTSQTQGRVYEWVDTSKPYHL